MQDVWLQPSSSYFLVINKVCRGEDEPCAGRALTCCCEGCWPARRRWAGGSDCRGSCLQAWSPGRASPPLSPSFQQLEQTRCRRKTHRASCQWRTSAGVQIIIQSWRSRFCRPVTLINCGDSDKYCPGKRPAHVPHGARRGTLPE